MSPMRTFEDYLWQTTNRCPGKTAIVCGDAEMTYARLWECIQARADQLRTEGLGPGMPRAIRAGQTAGFLVEYLATHLAGGVAMPMEHDIPDERLHEWEDLAARADIPDGTADILFTTGTTGKSKGVMISHEAIVANAENLMDAQGFSPGLTFIICGPLNHIGSLSKVYPTLMCGSTLHITSGMKDLSAFFAAFDRPGGSGKFATFLVPAGLRMLMTLGGGKLEACADAIDFIETGAAPLSQSDMERLCRLLPKTRLYNTYASTETGIICTHDFNGKKCVAGCLGKPMKHSEIFITEEGTVACRGKTLMSGYVGDPELTAAVLRDGILFTRDNGAIDEEGMLRLGGRADDVINVGGFKVAPSEVEDAAMSMPDIEDCVCIPQCHPVAGQVPKLLVVTTAGSVFDKKKIARFLHEKLETYKVPAAYEETDRIHRTYNGKIDRGYYRAHAK